MGVIKKASMVTKRVLPLARLEGNIIKAGVHTSSWQTKGFIKIINALSIQEHSLSSRKGVVGKSSIPADTLHDFAKFESSRTFITICWPSSFYLGILDPPCQRFILL